MFLACEPLSIPACSILDANQPQHQSTTRRKKTTHLYGIVTPLSVSMALTGNLQ